ncbi:PepSY domain-containing protein [Phenylobacterium sp.]|uniref:PepSY domain-containing protein n=1 Tax=Phenylobacterium sp. TaxID=1871053 RepID=UPI002810B007|nr:PepSY domain-containing protein [Phenylobacterium sp.]
MLTHRYLGVAVGLLMLLWFLSGVVMLFVRWPEVTPAERAARLQPIEWARCCDFSSFGPAQVLEGGVVESVAGRPVLRTGGETFDLEHGGVLAPLSRSEAMAVAQAYSGRPPVSARLLARDQWTVTGDFNARRPFWRVEMGDPARTVVHVSARTGEVAQATTRADRVLAWLGPIPHWLYPKVLRHDAKLWAQVVIWTSLAGLFLTVTGLYLGLIAWRPWRDARLSPFKGAMLWHHLTGLAAGLLTLTWTLSGLLSMQPWGLLESPQDPAAARYAASRVTVAEFGRALEAMRAEGLVARQVRLVPFEGRLSLVIDGRRPGAPLTPADLARASRALGPIGGQGLMRTEDAYWYGHHDTVKLPVWRVVRADGTRDYIDPGTGELLRSVDGAAQGFRWWHLALHRLDVIPGFDRGAGWAAAMTGLLLFAGFSVAIGVWLAWRRVQADVTRLGHLRRRRAV